MAVKLVDYARTMGISYKTAWRWFKAGKIAGRQMDTGTILVTETVPVPAQVASPKVAIYTRVSSAENTANLDSQAQRLVAYCTLRGYHVSTVVKEIGSGVHENRPRFLALLADLTSMVYSFCARLYGQRRAKHKTDQIVHLLEQDSHEEASEAYPGR